VSGAVGINLWSSSGNVMSKCITKITCHCKIKVRLHLNRLVVSFKCPMERLGYFTLLGLKFKVVWKEQFFSLCRMESKLSNPQFSELKDKKSLSPLSIHT
jgi:hypothetical protein